MCLHSKLSTDESSEVYIRLWGKDTLLQGRGAGGRGGAWGAKACCFICAQLVEGFQPECDASAGTFGEWQYLLGTAVPFGNKGRLRGTCICNTLFSYPTKHFHFA